MLFRFRTSVSYPRVTCLFVSQSVIKIPRRKKQKKHFCKNFPPLSLLLLNSWIKLNIFVYCRRFLPGGALHNFLHYRIVFLKAAGVNFVVWRLCAVQWRPTVAAPFNYAIVICDRVDRLTTSFTFIKLSFLTRILRTCSDKRTNEGTVCVRKGIIVINKLIINRLALIESTNWNGRRWILSIFLFYWCGLYTRKYAVCKIFCVICVRVFWCW